MESSEIKKPFERGGIAMSKILGTVKTIWLMSWAAFMTLFLFFPIMTTAFISKTGNLPFTLSKIWARVILFITGTRVKIRGKENINKKQSYVFISNHQSQFDILSIVATLGIQFRWVIKKEIMKVPLFGYALYKSRNIFVDRSNTERAKESIHRGLERLPDGVSVMVFAEGTRSPDGRLGKFKKGGFNIAQDKGFPILPVTVNGSRRVLPKKSFVFYPGTIDVVVGKPIDSTAVGKGALDELIAATRRAIEMNLVLDS